MIAENQSFRLVKAHIDYSNWKTTSSGRIWPTVRSGYLAQKRPHESSKGRHVQPARRRLDFGLLRDLQRVIYLDPEVSNGAFELAMTKQELNGP